MKSPVSRAFTLIELLVVMSLIGLVFSVIMTSIGVARAKARDAQRLSDLHQLENALALYRVDNGTFPVTENVAVPIYLGINGCGLGNNTSSGSTGWIPDLAPKYIRVLPSDPTSPTNLHCYVYASNGRDYMIVALQTVETYSGARNPKKWPFDSNGPNFASYTPGAATW